MEQSRYKRRCLVVIPTHKEFMTKKEEESLKNTLKILDRYDALLILPEGVSTLRYKKLIEVDRLKLSIKVLPTGWMGSIVNYNQMALSADFYRNFEEYEYILICHLDAWVFWDALELWMDCGYDYIGAPWFLPRVDSSIPTLRLMAPQGGNGGLSLRRVQKMIEITSGFKYSFNITLFIKGCYFLLINKRVDLLRIFLKSCKESYENLTSFQKKYNVYEDALISIFMSLFNKNLKVCPAREALHFSTEVNSEEIIATKLGWRMPFGLHGYDKYLSKPNSFDKYISDKKRIDYTVNISGPSKAKKIAMVKRPLVTIVTATFNLFEAGRVDTFIQCIQSVHNQTYDQIEHIIIDGGSTDGTLELIQKYVDMGWCICYSEKDNGVWDAMRRGHECARGEYVNYMNSDDYFSKITSVELAVNALGRSNADWLFADGMIVRKDGSQYVFPTSLFGVFSCMGILHQTMFVKRQLLNAIDPFSTKYVTRENYLMMVLIVNKFKHVYLKESIVCYREGGFSTTEYGNENLEKTKIDFANYYWDVIGGYWGMTPEECLSMFGWQCFGINGVRYSYNLSKKFQNIKFKYSFLKKLIHFAFKHKRIVPILLREFKLK